MIHTESVSRSAPEGDAKEGRASTTLLQGQGAGDGEDGLFLRSLTAEEAEELRNRWGD
jgi:hypothetical protein